jgi:hypothetical protein
LYVGNNSGPKHIAAALGVPTIGIHSGVVDAIEWGPIGKRAVAVRRNMTCSPCYIARPEDCPRNFACMRGLDPTLVQEVSEIFLGRAVGRRMQEALVELEPQVIVPSLVDAQQKGKRRRKATTSAPPDAAAPGVAAVADANDAPAAEAPAGAVDPAPKARRRRSQSSSVPVE